MFDRQALKTRGTPVPFSSDRFHSGYLFFISDIRESKWVMSITGEVVKEMPVSMLSAADTARAF